MEAQLFEWLSKAFGPGVAAGVFLYVYAVKNRPKSDDTVDRIFHRLDMIDENIKDVNTRVSRIEGRMDK